MKLHQFRLIRKCTLSKRMAVAVPRLAELTSAQVVRKVEYDRLFGHELAHCIEMMDRGQCHRLKLENFGWPVNKVGWFNPGTANTECKVFAIQYLIEEIMLGRADLGDALDIDMASVFIQSPRSWIDLTKNKAWVEEKRAYTRIEDYMNFYQPNIRCLLNTTIDYIVDECADLV